MNERATRSIICPSCGFKNVGSTPSERCASCGSRLEETVSSPMTSDGRIEFQQRTFDVKWFGIALGVMAALTGAIVIGLPRILTILDFEGWAGMAVAIPVWFAGGVLVGLISPGRTFTEPVAAVFLVALPTAFVLHQGQTVKTMPAFMYVLLAALGLLFTLIGAYVGERVQVGPTGRA